VGLIPLDVRLVAEGTAHHDARPRLHVDAFVLDDGYFLAEQGNAGVVADEVLVCLVVGVDEHRDTGREQFGPRRRDGERLREGRVVLDHLEGDVVEVAVLFVVFGLDL